MWDTLSFLRKVLFVQLLTAILSRGWSHGSTLLHPERLRYPRKCWVMWFSITDSSLTIIDSISTQWTRGMRESKIHIPYIYYTITCFTPELDVQMGEICRITACHYCLQQWRNYWKTISSSNVMHLNERTFHMRKQHFLKSKDKSSLVAAAEDSKIHLVFWKFLMWIWRHHHSSISPWNQSAPGLILTYYPELVFCDAMFSHL